MKKILLLITITCTALQMQAQRLYVQYKFNPELQALLANPANRAEYTAVQLRFTDDTGIHELARYTLSPGRVQQLEWEFLHSIVDTLPSPLIPTEEDFLDLNKPYFAGLTAESFDVISRLVDQLIALPADKRQITIDDFLRALLTQGPALGHSSLFGLALELTNALDAMGSTALEHDIAALTLTPPYMATFGQEPLTTEAALRSINTLISNAYQTTIVIPNAHNEHTLRKKDVINARFSPNGRFVAGMHSRGAAYVWDLATNEVINTPDRKRILLDGVPLRTSVYFSPDSHFMAVLNADRQVLIFDLTKGAALCSPENIRVLPHQNFPHLTYYDAVAAHFSPDGRTITTVCDNQYAGHGSISLTVQTWDLLDTTTPQTTMAIAGESGHFLHFSPDGRLLAGVHYSNISIYDLTKGEAINDPKNVLVLHTPDRQDSISAVCFSPDGQTIAGALAKGTVCIWDLKNGATNRDPILQLRGDHPNLYLPYLSVDFSPNGRYLIAGACDGTAHVWHDHDRERAITSLHAHSNAGIVPRIGLEALIIVSNMFDKLDPHPHPTTPEQDITFRNRSLRAVTAQFSPTGDAIVTVGSDETVRVWNIDPALQTVSPLGQLLLLACAQKTQFSPQQLNNLHDTYIALPTAAKKLIDTSVYLRFARLDVTNAVSKVVRSATTGLSWLKGAARSLASLITRRTSTSSGRQAAPAIAAIGSTAPTTKKAENSNSTILEEQMADLIKRKNFELAEALFEKYPELVRASTHYKEFAQAIADWRARNGKAGSSSSSSTDR